MASRPFTSQCTNVYNESTYQTIPHAFGLQNVTAVQAHDRTVYDTVKTCIASNFKPQIQTSCNNYCCDFSNPQVVHAQKQRTPCGGVTFTFTPAAGPQTNNLQNFGIGGAPANTFQQINQLQQPTCQQPLTVPQQIALKQLEQQGLELMLIQEQLKKNPYQVQFHHNCHTSTTDLLRGPCGQVPLSHGMPDLKNALATLASLKKDICNLGLDKAPPNSPPNTLYSEVYKAKRLILTKSPDVQKEKPKPSDSCITEEHPECESPNNNCTTGKEVAKTSRKSSLSDKKSKQQCKKIRKPKRNSSKRSQRSLRSNPESSESVLQHDSDDSDDDDSFDEDGDDNDDDSEESDH